MRDDTKNGCVADNNLGQNKMEQQTNNHPPLAPPIKDEAARRAKSRLILTDILLFINFRFCLENAGEEEKRQFLQEIDLMKDVGSHRNILSILGFWIRSEPIMLIMEYVPHGDLLKWLRNKRQQIKLVTVCIDFLPFSH